MIKAARSKSICFILIFTFFMFYSSYILTGQIDSKGRLIGIIYGKDVITSWQGQVVKLQSISTGTVYESRTDRMGSFMMNGIDEGLYIISLNTEKGDFKLESLLEVKSDETAIISVALTPQFLLVEANPRAELVGKGSLIGIVYEKDGITPAQGVIVKVRNLLTDAVYESIKTGKSGTFEIKEISEGLYLAGIVTAEGNFNVENYIGIKANEIVKLTFILKPYGIGKINNAEMKIMEIEKLRAAPKPVKFFSSAVGIATIIAGSSAITYGIVKLTEKEKEVSPFKK